MAEQIKPTAEAVQNETAAARRPSHPEKAFAPDTDKDGLPVEIETKIVDVGTAEEIIGKLTAVGAELTVPKRLLDDFRYKWPEETGAERSEPSSIINPGFFSDKHKLIQALELMGLILKEQPNGKLKALRQKNMPKRTVRIRRELGKSFFTVKEKRKISKKIKQKVDHRKEAEVEVRNEAELTGFFDHLGLALDARRQKHRTSYKLNNVLVELNEPPKDIAPWLEIEGRTDEKILETVKLLGFNPANIVSISDKDYLLKNGLSEEQASNLIFNA